ncbi:BNR/Asp-box repeat protein [Rosistilla ulvae]|uniref:exo-alpha-sialidase n=1 Tax=Rosistilla ulvae TaxID=1930277 RepID=A0A517M4Z1_9BACT|nr:sialidase family protein [Rosistilla ulvae]QDS89941.1 BNR/Asp-box repeat protein [Rosistilla ulvae]
MKLEILTGWMLFAVALLGIGSAVGDENESFRIIVPAPEGDRFCHLSWPKVVKADDGSIVVAYIAGRKHVNGDGCPAVSVSQDGGQSFTSPEVLKTFDSTMPYQHAANLAIGKAKDGAIVLMVMAFTDDLRNNIYGWRSEDHGKTWKSTDTSAIGESKTGSVFGHVFQVPNEGLAVCGHYRKPHGDGLWIAYSKDDGRTWNPPKTITTNKYYEPTFISTGGRLIGLVRENSAHAYHQYTSDDRGVSWQFQPSVIQGNKDANHPSPFIVSDPTQPDRLYALQTERTDKNQISLWQAESDTLQWKRNRLLTSSPGVEDFGYPWMTHLTGNEWFMVYYAGESDGPNAIYGRTITISPR